MQTWVRWQGAGRERGGRERKSSATKRDDHTRLVVVDHRSSVERQNLEFRLERGTRCSFSRARSPGFPSFRRSIEVTRSSRRTLSHRRSTMIEHGDQPRTRRITKKRHMLIVIGTRSHRLTAGSGSLVARATRNVAESRRATGVRASSLRTVRACVDFLHALPSLSPSG